MIGNNTSIILASASPRRKELLQMIVPEFEVLVSDCEEKIIGTVPQEVTMELSRQKAEAVVQNANRMNAIVIGADTVVSISEQILGKPSNREEAYWMLSLLSGRTHLVITGVTLVAVDSCGQIKQMKSFSETTQVCVAELSQSEIERYISTEEPYDKAGAYGIQGAFGRHIQGIHGDYNNVVGLPVHHLYEELKSIMAHEKL